MVLLLGRESGTEVPGCLGLLINVFFLVLITTGAAKATSLQPWLNNADKITLFILEHFLTVCQDGHTQEGVPKRGFH